MHILPDFMFITFRAFFFKTEPPSGSLSLQKLSVPNLGVSMPVAFH